MPTEPQMKSSISIEATDGPGSGNGLRKSGIDILGAIPWGTHFCQFYETPRDLIEILVPYFQEGLRQNEFCMWVTSEPLQAEDAKAALREAVPDLEGYLRQGQIEILDYSQWYTVSGKFDADRVLAGWVQKEQRARQRGYQGLRLSGNTFWLEKGDWDDFAEYEATVDRVIKNHRMIAICTYAVQRCNAVEVIDVVNNHQFALIKRSGQWEMMESRQRRRAEEGIVQRSAVLEGIHRIFRNALTSETEGQIGRLCLAVAEEVTGSKFGFIGEINPRTRLLDDIAISDPGWEVCRMRDPSGHGTTVPTGFRIHGIYGRVLSDGKSFFTNDPATHPDSIGTPDGHPALRAFLGVPLTQDGKTVGMVALGNREGGYRDEDLAAMEALAGPIVQVLMRRRAERQIQQLNRELEERVNQRTAELRAANESLQREIAERVKSEEVTSRLAAIVESSEDAITGKTLEGVITSWNRAAERMYGYAAAEMIGKSIAAITPPDRHNEIPQILEKIRRGQHVEHYETVRVRKDGQCIAVSLMVSPIKDPSGQVIGAAAIARNITRRKRMEEELRAASSYARSLIEASLDPLVTISPLGKITDVNKATEQATGVSRQELIGADFSGYFTQPENANEGYKTVISQGYVRDYPLTMRHVSGRTTDVLYNATTYRNELGQVQGVFAAARDITDRKRMEEELRAASAYARSLIEASVDPLVTISPEGKITDVNQATELATGVSREELIGKHFSGYFTDPAKAREGYQRVLSEGLVRDYPLTIRHASGRTTDVLYNATVYRNETGQVQGVFAAARDITDRKRMEEGLRAASLYARSLIEASLDPLVTISPEGKITDVNQATERATGVPRQDLIGSDFSIYFTEPERADQGYRRVLTEGLVRDYALTIRHTSGQTMDVLYNAAVYKNDAGELQGVFAAARDITQRKASERRQAVTNALLELFARKATRKEYLDSVVEVIRQWSGCRCAGIRVVDEQGNAPYECFLGFSREFWELENWICTKRDVCICARVILGTPEPQDAPVMTPAGSFRVDNAIRFVGGLPPEQQARFRGTCARVGFASIAAIPIRYRDQTLGMVHLADEREGMVPTACVEFIESMTPLIGEAIHRFNAEAELNKYREHLEELVRQRTEELQRAARDLARSNQDLEQFAYVASHDLQEPLRAVAGYVALLQRRYEGKLDEKADGYIAAAVEGAARMQSLIGDLLAYSRVDSRGRALEPADARSALDDALRNLDASLREVGARIHVGQLPTVQADGPQLTQLFQNLIGNAIRFRGDQPPEIRIEAKREADCWLFSVQDNGIGIEPEYADRIFLIFQRLHTRNKYPGTGIGLAICKRIVERHGGRIWVESQPGRGSTFYFTIPDRGERP